MFKPSKLKQKSLQNPSKQPTNINQNYLWGYIQSRDPCADSPPAPISTASPRVFPLSAQPPANAESPRAHCAMGPARLQRTQPRGPGFPAGFLECLRREARVARGNPSPVGAPVSENLAGQSLRTGAGGRGGRGTTCRRPRR